MGTNEICDGYSPIADYAAIGDCHTAALVSKDGSIDWYCPGRFDAPAVFCRLLDATRGGFFSVTPTGRFSAQRRYRGDTNILETKFAAIGGQVRLTDFMPIYRRTGYPRGHDVGGSRRIFRIIECLDGEVELEVRFKPTFDYGHAPGDSSIVTGGALAKGQNSYLALAASTFQLSAAGAAELRGTVRLHGGERCWLALTDADNPEAARRALTSIDFDREFKATIQYWEDWASVCTYRGPFRTAVLRSALALKLLTYEPTGAIVAAPTSSLPEEIGGIRNWDYRYTWLRDASLILYALMTIGYHDEAADFFNWLHGTQQAGPTDGPQVVYGIDGRRELPEIVLNNLEGYCCSRPVRIGNAAVRQRQLDIYGEVLTAAYLYYRGRRGNHPRPRRDTWLVLKDMVEETIRRWKEPDFSIWEVRGGPQLFTYSRLMCWAALDRGIRLAEAYGLSAPLKEWRRTREAIRSAIEARGYNADLGAFTQAFDSTALDASVLAIPRIGFLPPTEPRVLSTIRRIQAELTENGLVYRYRTADGLPGSEATFAICTFWLVDALAASGQLNEANELFARVAASANDVGLLSEQIDPHSGALLGNFPQGFSHLALIRAAVDLAKVAKYGVTAGAENEAERAAQAGDAAQQG